VDLGENYKIAAQRELKEELGIYTPIKDIGRFDVITPKERTIHHLFIGKYKKVIADPREISSFHFLSPKAIKKDIKLFPRKYAKSFHQAFKCYQKYINNI
jgi:8-oxo-dGTP pyrophosphatase MutT (NUDIX family)